MLHVNKFYSLQTTKKKNYQRRKPYKLKHKVPQSANDLKYLFYVP